MKACAKRACRRNEGMAFPNNIRRYSIWFANRLAGAISSDDPGADLSDRTTIGAYDGATDSSALSRRI
jgi:hypothetical protein